MGYMYEGIQFDDNMKEFFETIGVDTESMEECESKVKSGLAMIARRIRLGRAEIRLDAPKSKLRPEGQHHTAVLFDRGTDIFEEPLVMKFSLPDGGGFIIRDYSQGDSPYIDDEKEIHTFIFREVFFQFSRTMMKGLLGRVVSTDMSTGVSSPDAMMQFVAGKIGQGILDRYNVIFFNIHNFKYVNKVFPYEQGDIILRNYAQKVKGFLNSDEVISRLGGDNFVIMCRKERTEYLCGLLQNMRISHSWKMVEREFLLGATIGVADLDGVETPRDVMARCSTAYHVARRKGAGTLTRYTTEIQRKLMADQSIVSTFIPALDNEEFVVYYQPKVNISDRSICGAEALVRWIKEGKIIAPMRFIPQLEQEGSICMLDYYVLEHTCRFIRKRLDAGQSIVPISVNFSRRHLEEDDMVDRVAGIVDRYDIDRSYIEVELTESDDFQNYELMSNIINGLKDKGIRTAIDDFGTGFSSLNMIKKVDLSVIKIDKSFIPLETDYPGKDKDVIMFDSIVKLINKLGKGIVAEGVETREQLEYLRQVGCDVVQGYVFDKPLVQHEFERRLYEGYPDTFV